MRCACWDCECDIIAKARADEKNRCIEAVDALGAVDPWLSTDWSSGVNDALSALKALQEKPHAPLSGNPDMDAMSGYSDTHDKFCRDYNRLMGWKPETCICTVIAEVRADERAKDYVPVETGRGEEHVDWCRDLACYGCVEVTE